MIPGVILFSIPGVILISIQGVILISIPGVILISIQDVILISISGIILFSILISILDVVLSSSISGVLIRKLISIDSIPISILSGVVLALITSGQWSIILWWDLIRMQVSPCQNHRGVQYVHCISSSSPSLLLPIPPSLYVLRHVNN